ncbi:unnamed protein product [Linum tenue]|uniref:Uncharacterized protein n=1 Tax=Linum tenue TaxID=586396 RepID=A0AAV0N6A3_9ROSI|nr:unnamed protein product [Linum tenue]
MGRSPCCDKVGLKKGPWTPEEDQMLLAYIEEHGHGSWRALPSKAGLQRCGKSCRLRWTNYLRPDIKRGKFSLQEEQTIIQLHALLGNRWSAIATHLQKRTDNEIKNYWNTHLKKRLTKMGIDPVTHKPKNDALLTTQAGSDYSNSKSAANLSHMAQWESARLEAEARLVRQSKLRSHSLLATLAAAGSTSATATSLKSWSASSGINVHVDLESPTSTLSTALPGNPIRSSDHHDQDDRSPSIPHMFEFIKDVSHRQHDDESDDWTVCQLAADHHPSINDRHHHHINAVASGGTISCGSSMEAGGWTLNNKESSNDDVAEEGFISLLLCDSSTAGAGDHQEHGCSSEVNNNSEVSGNDKNSTNKDSSENNSGSTTTTTNEHEYYEDKNYWNSILNLVDTSSPSPDGDTPMF